MVHLLQQIAFMGVFFVLPGVMGAWLAHSKGRNPLLWFVINCLFPPTLMISIFQGPKRPVAGYYRQCTKCLEYSKWRETVCRFCQTDLPV
jgi:hypothetical protein